MGPVPGAHTAPGTSQPDAPSSLAWAAVVTLAFGMLLLTAVAAAGDGPFGIDALLALLICVVAFALGTAAVPRWLVLRRWQRARWLSAIAGIVGFATGLVVGGWWAFVSEPLDLRVGAVGLPVLAVFVVLAAPRAVRLPALLYLGIAVAGTALAAALRQV